MNILKLCDMPPEKHEIEIIIKMLASYELVNEELGDLLKDIRELAESRGFVVF